MFTTPSYTHTLPIQLLFQNRQSCSNSSNMWFTYRCISYQEALDGSVFRECASFFPEDKCHFFNYGVDFNYLEATLQILLNVLRIQASSNYCKDVVLSYVCNYVYPGCNTSLETPVGICREECLELTQGRV